MPTKKSDVTTSEGGTQTDLEIFCAKCTEPIEHAVETAQVEMKSGSLRVKNEFKLRKVKYKLVGANKQLIL